MIKARFWIATALVFAFMFLYEWGVHEHLLKDMYEATKDMWRPREVMETLCYWTMITNAAIAFTITLIFVHNYENRGIGEGIRFGILIGILIGSLQFGIYPYLPIPFKLAGAWFISSLIEGIGIGIILSITYKRWLLMMRKKAAAKKAK